MRGAPSPAPIPAPAPRCEGCVSEVGWGWGGQAGGGRSIVLCAAPMSQCSRGVWSLGRHRQVCGPSPVRAVSGHPVCKQSRACPDNAPVPRPSPPAPLFIILVYQEVIDKARLLAFFFAAGRHRRRGLGDSGGVAPENQAPEQRGCTQQKHNRQKSRLKNSNMSKTQKPNPYNSLWHGCNLI